MKFKQRKIYFGLSERKDGQMRLVINQRNLLAQKNRFKFFGGLGFKSFFPIVADLVHGKKITIVSPKDAGKIIAKTDGLVTQSKNLILTVTAADCLPLYFFDQKNEVIGLAHAGWRGVKKNIAGQMIKIMISKFKSQPDDIKVYIGPHIQKCHFDVLPDLGKKFKIYKKFIFKKNNQIFIDLSGIVFYQLVEMGLKKNNITISSDCTFCQKKYFSNRRDHPEQIEAMMAYIVQS